MAGTYYSVQNFFPFIGATIVSGTATFSLVTLTGTGSDNRKEIDIDKMQQTVLYVRYITGTDGVGSVLNATVEFSPDGTNYYQEATEAVSTATVTEYQATRQFTGAAGDTAYMFRIAIPIADIKKMRIGFSETKAGTKYGRLGVLAITSGQ